MYFSRAQSNACSSAQKKTQTAPIRLHSDAADELATNERVKQTSQVKNTHCFYPIFGVQNKLCACKQNVLFSLLFLFLF